VELTGPAAAFVVRPARYGVRLARVLPALARAPGWRVEADVRRGDGLLHFGVRGRPRAAGAAPPVGPAARRTGYDSTWERALAAALRRQLRDQPAAWTLAREDTPVDAGGELFLPDFTLRHADGREALVELVGFWTPEYLEAKVRKIAAAGLDHLVLVVSRRLAVGAAREALAEALTAALGAGGTERVVWFAERPRAAEVLRAAEGCARRPPARAP